MTNLKPFFRVNLQTHEIASTSLTYSIGHFEVDPDSDTLITLIWHPPAWDFQLVRIDPTTAGITPIAAMPQVKALFQGASVLDPSAHLYIFPGFDANDVQRLYIVDIQTGELVASPELVVISGASSLAHELLSSGFAGDLKSFEAVWSHYHYYQVYLPLVRKKK